MSSKRNDQKCYVGTLGIDATVIVITYRRVCHTLCLPPIHKWLPISSTQNRISKLQNPLLTLRFNRGLKSSELSLSCKWCQESYWHTSSRPKTIDDISAQEHTVAVLRKTLTSTNVSLLLASISKIMNTASFLICYSMDPQEQERLRQSWLWRVNSLGIFHCYCMQLPPTYC